MYNTHRGIGPTPNNRLSELLEQVRAEFDSQQNRTGEYEANSMFSTCLTIFTFIPLCCFFSLGFYLDVSLSRYDDRKALDNFHLQVLGIELNTDGC